VNRKSVVVLGLARSGTSVVTGILRALGVDIGSPLADKANPYGSFEDRDFADLHKKIFDLAGNKTYWNPPAPETILTLKEKCGPLIEEVVRKKSRACPVWGWKHPRTILTLELFLPYLENPHLIAVFRNPLDIANSSVEHTKKYTADRVDFFQALTLVNFYSAEMVKVLERHRELPLMPVAFENVVSEPIKEAEKMANFLELELNEHKTAQLESLVIPRVHIAQEKARSSRFFTGKIPRLLRKYRAPFFR
jgi:hypothetical protein